jgi:hypothetical protein
VSWLKHCSSYCRFAKCCSTSKHGNGTAHFAHFKCGSSEKVNKARSLKDKRFTLILNYQILFDIEKNGDLYAFVMKTGI